MKQLTLVILLLLETTLYAQNYKIEFETEYILPSTAMIAVLTPNNLIQTRSIDTIVTFKSYNLNDVNLIDRSFHCKYNQSTSNISDYLLGTMILLPVFTNLNDFKSSWELPVMYAENLLGTFAITSIVKLIVQRSRPYNYYSDTPLDILNGGDSQFSFFSGHTSLAFSSAVFNSIVFELQNSSSEYKGLVWTLSLAGAASTGLLRILAGQHFLTDVIAGALIGTIVGWSIPQLNNYEETISNSEKIVNSNLIIFRFKI